MQLLLESGLPSEKLVEILQSLREDEEAARPVQSAAARRQAKHRAKKAQESITERNAVTLGDETHNGASPGLSLPPSPQTPQPPTHTRSVITSREAHAREDAAFAKFWALYPRKTAKADARKAFAKAWRKLPTMDEEGILTGGLERAKAAWTDAQFIPHAATWLNGERWRDEPAEVIPLSPRKADERPHTDPKFAARQANLDRALAGADSAAGRRWEP